METKKQLPAPVAKRYELKHMVEAGIVMTRKGLVDLSTISLKRAKELAEDDSFRYLEKKPKATTKTKP